MTIHNAKGLEWDFVVIPQLEGSAGTNRYPLLSWMETGDDVDDADTAHGMIAPIHPRGSDAHALNKWMRSIHSAREASELKRLFYVASTRARRQLHLFASPDRTKTGKINWPP